MWNFNTGIFNMKLLKIKNNLRYSKYLGPVSHVTKCFSIIFEFENGKNARARAHTHTHTHTNSGFIYIYIYIYIYICMYV